MQEQYVLNGDIKKVLREGLLDCDLDELRKKHLNTVNRHKELYERNYELRKEYNEFKRSSVPRPRYEEVLLKFKSLQEKYNNLVCSSQARYQSLCREKDEIICKKNEELSFMKLEREMFISNNADVDVATSKLNEEINDLKCKNDEMSSIIDQLKTKVNSKIAELDEYVRRNNELQQEAICSSQQKLELENAVIKLELEKTCSCCKYQDEAAVCDIDASINKLDVEQNDSLSDTDSDVIEEYLNEMKISDLLSPMSPDLPYTIDIETQTLLTECQDNEVQTVIITCNSATQTTVLQSNAQTQSTVVTLDSAIQVKTQDILKQDTAVQTAILTYSTPTTYEKAVQTNVVVQTDIPPLKTNETTVCSSETQTDIIQFEKSVKNFISKDAINIYVDRHMLKKGIECIESKSISVHLCKCSTENNEINTLDPCTTKIEPKISKMESDEESDRELLRQRMKIKLINVGVQTDRCFVLKGADNTSIKSTDSTIDDSLLQSLSGKGLGSLECDFTMLTPPLSCDESLSKLPTFINKKLTHHIESFYCDNLIKFLNATYKKHMKIANRHLKYLSRLRFSLSTFEMYKTHGNYKGFYKKHTSKQESYKKVRNWMNACHAQTNKYEASINQMHQVDNNISVRSEDFKDTICQSNKSESIREIPTRTPEFTDACIPMSSKAHKLKSIFGSESDVSSESGQIANTSFSNSDLLTESSEQSLSLKGSNSLHSDKSTIKHDTVNLNCRIRKRKFLEDAHDETYKNSKRKFMKVATTNRRVKHSSTSTTGSNTDLSDDEIKPYKSRKTNEITTIDSESVGFSTNTRQNLLLPPKYVEKIPSKNGLVVEKQNSFDNDHAELLNKTLFDNDNNQDQVKHVPKIKTLKQERETEISNGHNKTVIKKQTKVVNNSKKAKGRTRILKPNNLLLKNCKNVATDKSEKKLTKIKNHKLKTSKNVSSPKVEVEDLFTIENSCLNSNARTNQKSTDFASFEVNAPGEVRNCKVNNLPSLSTAQSLSYSELYPSASKVQSIVELGNKKLHNTTNTEEDDIMYNNCINSRKRIAHHVERLEHNNSNSLLSKARIDINLIKRSNTSTQIAQSDLVVQSDFAGSDVNSINEYITFENCLESQTNNVQKLTVSEPTTAPLHLPKLHNTPVSCNSLSVALPFSDSISNFTTITEKRVAPPVIPTIASTNTKINNASTLSFDLLAISPVGSRPSETDKISVQNITLSQLLNDTTNTDKNLLQPDISKMITLTANNTNNKPWKVTSLADQCVSNEKLPQSPDKICLLNGINPKDCFTVTNLPALLQNAKEHFSQFTSAATAVPVLHKDLEQISFTTKLTVSTPGLSEELLPTSNEVIHFDTPASPPPADQKLIEPPPIIIPIERASQQLSLSTKLEKVNDSKVVHDLGSITKAEVNEEEQVLTNAISKRLLRSLVGLVSTYDIELEVTEQFLDINPQVIARTLVYFIEECVHSKREKRRNKRVCISIAQKKLLGFLLLLTAKKQDVNFSKIILDTLELSIIECNNDTFVISITEFYVSYCMICDSIFRTRLFIVKALHQMGSRVLPVLYVIIVNWMTVFTEYELNSSDSLVLRGLVQTIRCRNTVEEVLKGYNIVKLLHQCYKYPFEAEHTEKLVVELLCEYFDDPDPVRKIMIIMLCSEMNIKTIYKAVEDSIIKKYSELKLDGIKTLISCIEFILDEFKTHPDTSAKLQKLCEEFKRLVERLPT